MIGERDDIALVHQLAKSGISGRTGGAALRREEFDDTFRRAVFGLQRARENNAGD